MLILAVSTSAKNPSAALLRADGSIAVKTDESGSPHSVSLMPLVDELLSENGIRAEDADLFAVDIGPGSFTGVRIGVSAVNAMAAACKKMIVPVSSLAALRHARGEIDGDKTVVTLLDARNGNGYAAVYRGGACVLKPCACVIGEIMAQYGEQSVLIGDCFGMRDQCSAELVIREALAMLDKAKANGEDCLVSSAVPLYLRPSQAERMKNKTEQ